MKKIIYVGLLLLVTYLCLHVNGAYAALCIRTSDGRVHTSNTSYTPEQAREIIFEKYRNWDYVISPTLDHIIIKAHIVSIESLTSKGCKLQ